jgi:hypothetical protein
MKNSSHLTSSNYVLKGLFTPICWLMSCLLLTTQLQAQCDCDPILTGGEDEVTEDNVTDAFGVGVFVLTGGSYHITTDLTINTNFTLTGGVRFSIDPGVAYYCSFRSHFYYYQ